MKNKQKFTLMTWKRVMLLVILFITSVSANAWITTAEGYYTGNSNGGGVPCTYHYTIVMWDEGNGFHGTVNYDGPCGSGTFKWLPVVPGGPGVGPYSNNIGDYNWTATNNNQQPIVLPIEMYQSGLDMAILNLPTVQ